MAKLQFSTHSRLSRVCSCNCNDKGIYKVRDALQRFGDDPSKVSPNDMCVAVSKADPRPARAKCVENGVAFVRHGVLRLPSEVVDFSQIVADLG